MHNTHISGTVQDVRTTSVIETSSILQNCIESTLKGIKGVVIFQDDVLVYETTQEQFDRRKLAVKIRLREKIFTINEKKISR